MSEQGKRGDLSNLDRGMVVGARRAGLSISQSAQSAICFRPLSANCLNARAYLSIVFDHDHPFMATMYPSSDGYFQQDNAPCHKA